MERLDILLQYLRDNNYHMTSFLFTYKRVGYVVLFEDLINLPLVNEGYDVFLTFINIDNEDIKYSLKANSRRFDFSVKEFRAFFGIEYSDNLGDVFKQFYAYFNNYIPETVNIKHTDQERRLTLERLNRNENDNGICCFKVKRNPMVDGKQRHRTPFNGQKCRMLKPDLYTHFEHDNTISFCFREKNELRTSEILQNFANQEANRR